MRLIDADALMKVIRQHEYPLATRLGAIGYGMFTLGIQQAVDEAPTIDAVPVVRCKDCKHFVQSEPYDPCECMKWAVKWGVAYTSPDDFCSYGEKRDEEGKSE